MVIVADDMGFSDLGCYGSEIHTPNLDRLASNGLRFTEFYNTGRCWPSRAAILTGYYAQQVRRDALPGIKSGNNGTRPAWARLLPEMLRPLGYRSYHSGKWHVDGQPLKNGFDHESVNHSKKQYSKKGKDGGKVTTNTVESSFALLKRGIVGAFHHVSKEHLHRYTAEFDFRWNHRKTTDGERTDQAIRQTVGKRLSYKAPKVA